MLSNINCLRVKFLCIVSKDFYMGNQLEITLGMIFKVVITKFNNLTIYDNLWSDDIHIKKYICLINIWSD